MRQLSRFLTAALLLLVPAAAFAQGTLAGTVKDPVGAAIPGVEVEATSPVLIERSRSTVTNGTGQFKIVDLRPGTYTVTFTLPGFTTVKRDDVELTGSFTATLNVEMKIGKVEETIVVTGETPVVDIQSTTKERVLTQEQVNTLPTGRMYQNLGTLVPGVTSNQVDVGGTLGDQMASLTAHGSRTVDMRVTNNGVNTATLQAGGGIGMATPNPNSAQEITIDTAAVDASLATGGPRINFIPRDGGNELKIATFANGTWSALQADNLTSRVQALGLTAANGVKRNWDINPAFGGPIVRDKVWYWATVRHQVADLYVGGMYNNLNANDPTKFTYAPDVSQQAHNDQTFKDTQGRVTWQVTPKNKVAATYDQQWRCQCPMYITATKSPEAASDRRSPTQQLMHGEWTSPVTGKLLLEAVGLYRTERWGNMAPSLEGFASGSAPGIVGILDQGGSIPNLIYRAGGSGTNNTSIGVYNSNWVPNSFYRAAASYVTGSHAFKAGFNDAIGSLETTTSSFTNLSYRFNSSQLTAGSPANQLTEYSNPITTKAELHHDFGVYAQDKWTLNRMTVTAGMRFDWFSSGFPDQAAGPSTFTPARNISCVSDVRFCAQGNLNWKDITPRLGIVYDLTGDGKTAIRASANKYLLGQGLNALGSTPNPVNLLQTSTTRSWTDSNKNFIPDCDLGNPAKNGECGSWDSPLFGSTNAAQSYDPNLLGGWGHRPSNWEFSAGVQRELVPRVSVDVAWFRRVWSNFQVTDSLAVTPASFTEFQIVAPADPRLPASGGYTVTGLYNQLPTLQNGLNTTQLFNTLDHGGSNGEYGTQLDHWNGIDFTVNARLADVQLQGGVSSGHQLTDNCAIVAKVPEMLISGSTITPAQYCHNEEPWLTQYKLSGSVLVPGVAVRVSGAFSSTPGAAISGNFVASNGFLSSPASSTLGRTLNAGTNATINVVTPNTIYGERLNNFDVRFGRPVMFGKSRTTINVDLYNVFNSDTVLTYQNTFDPTKTTESGGWRSAQSILQARFLKFGVQFDF